MQRHQIHPCWRLCRVLNGIFTASLRTFPAAGQVYIQASLHADELPGMLVAWHLKQRLAELEAAGRLRVK